MDEIITNIREAIAVLKTTANAFAIKAKIDPSNFGKMLEGKQNITNKTIMKICSAHDLSMEWVKTGEGPMLVDPETKAGHKKNDKAIPFYDVHTTGGYNGVVSSSDTHGDVVGYVEPGGWFDGHETAAIRHVGNSMDEYPDGCILVVREVVDRRLLVPGHNYVVETSEYRVTKRVQLGTRQGYMALYSTNQDRYADGRMIYEPFEIPLEDIKRIFSVLGYVVNQSGELRLIRP